MKNLTDSIESDYIAPMRANDPATGEPFKTPSKTEKFVGWMWSKYSRKVLLKIGVVTAPIVGMIAAKFGNTPSANEAIGIGLSALVLGLLDFVVSYVGKRLGYTNLESLQKLSEEQEPIRPQPAIPFTSDSSPTFTGQFVLPDGYPATRSEMFKAIIAKPTSSSEDDSALLELRESLLKPAPTMPTVAEQEATRAKLYGYSVEVDGEVHDFLDKFAAIQFRNNARADGQRATLLF